MGKKMPIKITNKEQSFHRMNDVIMQIAKIYVRQHNKMQDFGVGNKLCRAEIHTIQAIGNNEGINLTELATLLDVSKPTVSERIKKLIRLKLIKKRLKERNNKEVRLTLTDQGWSAYHSHEKQHKEIFQLFEEHFGNHRLNEIFDLRQQSLLYTV
jgi:DNA-binding MarR family transcriptional regulator